MAIYIESPKEFMKNLLELICEFCKGKDYKDNIKIIVFLCSSTKQLENKT